MKKILQQKGTVLIIAVLTLMILLLLGIYFLSFAATEFNISKSQISAIQTYYLAEAGANEAIWRVKNDDAWKECFTSSTALCDCENWSTSTIEDTSSLLEESSYKISIEDLACARGKVTVVATSSSGGGTSKRVIETKIFQPLASLTKDSVMFSGSPSGEVNINLSEIDIYSGNLFSNNNINIKSFSTVNVYDNQTTTAQEGLTLALRNVNVTHSTLNSSSTCAKNACEENCPDYTSTTVSCPPSSIDVPAVDFDSASSSSYKSKAQAAQEQGQCEVLCNGVVCSNNCVFTADEFSNLLWQVDEGGTLKLDYLANGLATSTYYVEGPVTIKGGRKLDIDGVLVADGDISVGESLCWNLQCGFDQVTVTDPGKGIPSGILTKGEIDFGPYSSLATTSIEGLLYSLGKMDLTSLPKTFKIKGGIISSKFSLFSLLSPLEFYLDNDMIKEGVWGGPAPSGSEKPSYSPVVTVEHWEEVY